MVAKKKKGILIYKGKAKDYPGAKLKNMFEKGVIDSSTKVSDLKNIEIKPQTLFGRSYNDDIR